MANRANCLFSDAPIGSMTGVYCDTVPKETLPPR